ncbi:hypothetical protein BpHYR1_025396 [Brachionus plicatilis]|uniref:Uncharacterized protein n=1 Tax=Brachionus plicatilis TaxID=10195 RepID=A0A3M7RHL6_BRAPC|nr:hypothetical protein BpHYR1_025396 [Brachionus plicatilis]
MFNSYPSASFGQASFAVPQPSFASAQQYSGLGSAYNFGQAAALSSPQFNAAQLSPFSLYGAQSLTSGQSFSATPSFGSYPGLY